MFITFLIFEIYFFFSVIADFSMAADSYLMDMLSIEHQELNKIFSKFSLASYVGLFPRYQFSIGLVFVLSVWLKGHFHMYMYQCL